MYNGLTTADKGALEIAQKNGHAYVYLAHDGFPTGYNVNEALAQIAEMESNEVIGTDLASIQMDGMYNQLHANDDRGSLTWNDRINQMTVEEKAVWLRIEGTKMHNECARYAWDCVLDKRGSFCERYHERMTKLLNSPYTEGEKENG